FSAIRPPCAADGVITAARSDESRAPPALEDESPPKLQLTRRRALGQRRNIASAGSNRGHCSDARNVHGTGVDCQLRICGCVVILNVEHVEALKTELQAHAFANRNFFEHGEVHVDHMRSAEDITAQVAKRTGRNAERARVEPSGGSIYSVCGPPPLRDGQLAFRVGVRSYRPGDKRVSNQVRPGVSARTAWRTASEIGNIPANLQIVRCARARLEDVVGLPIAQNPRQRTAMEPRFSSPKRKLIDGSPRHKVLNVI